MRSSSWTRTLSPSAVVLEGHTDLVKDVHFSPTGALLASASLDGSVIVWDVATGERRESLRANSAGGLPGVGFSPDEETLYTIAGRTLLASDLTGERRFIARRQLLEPAVSALADGSPSGDAVAYMGDPPWVQFLDLGTSRAGPVIETGHGAWGWFAWRPDGRHFATAGEDGFVRVWDWRTGQLVIERHVAPMKIAAVKYTPDGERLIVAEQEGTTYAIDAETLEPDGTPIHLDQPMWNVFESPDNHTALVLTEGGRFTLVDLDTGQVIHEGEAPDAVRGDFSPDGRRFAVGSSFGAVRLLDVETGEWVGPSTVGHDGSIISVDYAPDGATFATGADDGAIVFWDADTGTPLNKVLPGRPTDGPTNPTFLADGHTVMFTVMFTENSGGAVYTMDTRPEHWIEVACAIAGRNLTEAEWSHAFADRPYRETCPAASRPDAELPE